MRWESGRRSDNVEDERGSSGGGGGFKIGGIGLLLIVGIAILTKQNPLTLLSQIAEQSPQVQQQPSETPGTPPAQPGQPGYDKEKDFVSVVLGDTEDTWTEVFQKMNRQYIPPKLLLFTGAVRSGCGVSSAEVGPFYCPVDSKVYLDLDFFHELSQRFGAPGDFAQAYVVAHEVGHHVQNLLGISDKVHQLEEQARNQEQANAYSVRLELQADCFAGVWGHYSNQERKILEPGDLEEGLNAAAAVGDDKLQKMGGQAVSPESWTHGSSQQRVSWFQRGFQSGDINSCDTFNAN